MTEREKRIEILYQILEKTKDADEKVTLKWVIFTLEREDETRC